MKTSSPNAIPIPKVNFCCQGIRPIFFTFALDLEAIISKQKVYLDNTVILFSRTVLAVAENHRIMIIATC